MVKHKIIWTLQCIYTRRKMCSSSLDKFSIILWVLLKEISSGKISLLVILLNIAHVVTVPPWERPTSAWEYSYLRSPTPPPHPLPSQFPGHLQRSQMFIYSLQIIYFNPIHIILRGVLYQKHYLLWFEILLHNVNFNNHELLNGQYSIDCFQWFWLSTIT